MSRHWHFIEVVMDRFDLNPGNPGPENTAALSERTVLAVPVGRTGVSSMGV
jgi:hypothetical protein